MLDWYGVTELGSWRAATMPRGGILFHANPGEATLWEWWRQPRVKAGRASLPSKQMADDTGMLGYRSRTTALVFASVSSDDFRQVGPPVGPRSMKVGRRRLGGLLPHVDAVRPVESLTVLQ